MTSTYADEKAVSSYLTPPEVDSGQAFADKIKEQGPQVQVVNWIWEHVTGENLVEALIAPMTGDWARIAGNGDAWRNAGEAIEQVSGNLSHNIPTLRRHWDGDAAQAFEQSIDTTWGLALYAEAAVAKLIGKGFDFLSEQSERLCQEALDLITKLINKLVSAASTAWIPVVGWARAAKIVWDAYQIYQAIMGIYETIKSTIEAAQKLMQEAHNIKNALAEIRDAGSVSDAMEGAQDLKSSAEQVKQSIDDITGAPGSIRGDASDARDATKDLREQLGRNGQNGHTASQPSHTTHTSGHRPR